MRQYSGCTDVRPHSIHGKIWRVTSSGRRSIMSALHAGSWTDFPSTGRKEYRHCAMLHTTGWCEWACVFGTPGQLGLLESTGDSRL